MKTNFTAPKIDALIPSDHLRQNNKAENVSPELFKEALQTAQTHSAKAAADGLASGLKFSNHAIDRMSLRGISFDKDTLARIETAVSKAKAKGSKDTLVLTPDSALVISAKDNMVVTVMDRQAMKENVFTNIDSTVFA